jgi:polysaccharide biosynthesis protein PslG
MRRALLAALAAVLLLPAVAGAKVPPGFVGVTADGPALIPHFDFGTETALMKQSGVQSVRIQFGWSGAQPYANWSQVPADQRASFVDEGGIPTNWTALDRLVTLITQAGLTVLPVVQYPPGWDALHPGDISSPPARPVPYAAFLAALVHRYGPNGSFWTANPTLRPVPIRAWQVWNEPNIPYQWSVQPFAKAYVRLLKAAHRAIKRADPSAQVILAGLTNFSWTDLGKVYRRPGARGAFDAVAVNTYTKSPAGVITILARIRKVMRRYGDRRKPLYATEVGWPASVPVVKALYGFETTPQGQASRLAKLMPLLARNRRALRLRGFYVYSWIGQEGPGRDEFNFSGLRKTDPDLNGVTSKPALAAFSAAAHALER